MADTREESNMIWIRCRTVHRIVIWCEDTKLTDRSWSVGNRLRQSSFVKNKKLRVIVEDIPRSG